MCGWAGSDGQQNEVGEEELISSVHGFLAGEVSSVVNSHNAAASSFCRPSTSAFTLRAAGHQEKTS